MQTKTKVRTKTRTKTKSNFKKLYKNYIKIQTKTETITESNYKNLYNKWHSYRSGTRSPEGAEIMHHIYAKLRLCMHNTSRKRCFRTFDLYFDLEDGTPSQ